MESGGSEIGIMKGGMCVTDTQADQTCSSYQEIKVHIVEFSD
jgi:hypothetical protein